MSTTAQLHKLLAHLEPIACNTSEVPREDAAEAIKIVRQLLAADPWEQLQTGQPVAVPREADRQLMAFYGAEDLHELIDVQVDIIRTMRAGLRRILAREGRLPGRRTA